MFVSTWDEFEKTAQNIYLQDPLRARYSLKYNHSRSSLSVKMTDDVTCVQYKTEVAQDVRKIEKFINNLMRHMTSKNAT
ncbi:signal recognition particle 9 kDa protein-like [Macrosteles quadrilineatus]|uniref:signal recognition particle 9 kDa protein-like n=1 Tax=Macrosteles quadrilineatus TaxID=74068 RepID=UPI0023E090BF|nr:signal recognition particle 9 kDa protein-like [Macrosteles quadrilineatus]